MPVLECMSCMGLLAQQYVTVLHSGLESVSMSFALGGKGFLKERNS